MKKIILLIMTVLGADNCMAQDLSWIDKPILKVINDPDTIWYDGLYKTFPDHNHLISVGYNLAGNLDKTGSANNEQPWMNTSGMESAPTSACIRRFIYIPGKIKMSFAEVNFKSGSRNMTKSYPYGVYPNGTIAGQIFCEGLRPFAIRVLQKENSFHGFERTNDPPDWYKSPQNCIDCHSDIHKHAFEIDSVRDWYGTVRGLEIGGPIHFHPYDTSELEKNGHSFSPIKFREDILHKLDLSFYPKEN